MLTSPETTDTRHIQNPGKYTVHSALKSQCSIWIDLGLGPYMDKTLRTYFIRAMHADSVCCVLSALPFLLPRAGSSYRCHSPMTTSSTFYHSG